MTKIRTRYVAILWHTLDRAPGKYSASARHPLSCLLAQLLSHLVCHDLCRLYLPTPAPPPPSCSPTPTPAVHLPKHLLWPVRIILTVSALRAARSRRNLEPGSSPMSF